MEVMTLGPADGWHSIIAGNVATICFSKSWGGELRMGNSDGGVEIKQREGWREGHIDIIYEWVILCMENVCVCVC